MGIGDAITQQHFPFTYEQVFNAINAVLPEIGYSIRSQDRLIGRITASAGMSAFSFGENITIQVQKTDDASSTIVVQSNLKVGVNLAGTSNWS
jgi:hypothetical protein